MKNITKIIKIVILTYVILSLTIALHSINITKPIRYDPLIEYKEPEKPKYDIKQLKCLALNVYFESRGEPSLGQHSVAWVTRNRVKSVLYPNTICDVVYQDNQFSWTHDKLSDTPKDKMSWKRALYIAYVVYKDHNILNDPTDGSVMFHAVSVKPYWRKAYTKTKKIGSHIFYKEKE